MKKLVFFISVICLTLVLAACGQAKSENRSEKQHNKIVVGLDDHFPPMGFRGENGELVGFDIDLAREILEGLGYEVEFKAVDWDGVLLSLNNKDIDVIWNGLTITEERKKKIAFSDPYLVNSQILIVSGDSKIKSIDELEGGIIGVQLGSSSETVINNNKEKMGIKEIKKFANNVDALLDLRAGRVQAVLVDEVVGRYYISKEADNYRVLEENLGGEEYGVGLRKEDEELKKQLDGALKAFMEQDGFKEIREKWFGK